MILTEPGKSFESAVEPKAKSDDSGSRSKPDLKAWNSEDSDVVEKSVLNLHQVENRPMRHQGHLPAE